MKFSWVLIYTLYDFQLLLIKHLHIGISGNIGFLASNCFAFSRHIPRVYFHAAVSCLVFTLIRYFYHQMTWGAIQKTKIPWIKTKSHSAKPAKQQRMKACRLQEITRGYKIMLSKSVSTLTKKRTSNAFRKSINTGALSEEVRDCFYILRQHRTRWSNGPFITSVCSSATAPWKECLDKHKLKTFFYTRMCFWRILCIVPLCVIGSVFGEYRA